MFVCVARLFNPGSRLSRVLKQIGIAEKLLLQLLIDLQELRLASSSSCSCTTTGIVVVVVSFSSSLSSIQERGSSSQLSASFSSFDRSCCTSRHCSAHALFNNATERKKETTTLLSFLPRNNNNDNDKTL